jgi:hypothetical protein
VARADATNSRREGTYDCLDIGYDCSTGDDDRQGDEGMIHTQTNLAGVDPTAKWLKRAAWLLLIVTTVIDVAVTFGPKLGIHARWF